MPNQKELLELFSEIKNQINLYLNSASRLDFYLTELDTTYQYLMNLMKISIPKLEEILICSNDIEKYDSCNIAINSLVEVNKRIANEFLFISKDNLINSLRKIQRVAENLEKNIKDLENIFYESNKLIE